MNWVVASGEMSSRSYQIARKTEGCGSSHPSQQQQQLGLGENWGRFEGEAGLFIDWRSSFISASFSWRRRTVHSSASLRRSDNVSGDARASLPHPRPVQPDPRAPCAPALHALLLLLLFAPRTHEQPGERGRESTKMFFHGSFCDNFLFKYPVRKPFSPLDCWYFFASYEIHFEYFLWIFFKFESMHHRNLYL